MPIKTMMFLFLLFACTQSPEPLNDEPITRENLDQGQQHPPLPANNPVWKWDAKGFVPDFGWYGEHSWMDVRMRVAGHLSAAGRDKARLLASQSKWTEATAAYQTLAKTLQSIPSSTKGVSSDINSLLIEAAQRDAKLLQALQKSTPIPLGKGSLAPLRARYLRLARKYMQGEDVSKDAAALQKELEAFLTPREDLAIDGFQDFKSRHLLRIRLFEAYLDALDPIGLAERWGYWTSNEIIRQALAIGVSAGKLGGEDWTDKARNTHTLATIQTKENALLWPSEIAKTLRSSNQKISLSNEEFGALPTGDSLIDVAAHPGPKAIGDLMKWGLTDNQHQKWLANAVQDIMNPIEKNPDAAIRAYQKHAKYLDEAKHGSRFYNVKQLRNATVRQLALQGHYSEAYTVLMENFPLHHQDWACPNREGILLAIAGRLQILSGEKEASQTLDRALKAGLEFLEKVDQAERGTIRGPRPPQLKVPSKEKHRGPKNPNHTRPQNRNAPPAPR